MYSTRLRLVPGKCVYSTRLQLVLGSYVSAEAGGDSGEQFQILLPLGQEELDLLGFAGFLLTPSVPHSKGVGYINNLRYKE